MHLSDLLLERLPPCNACMKQTPFWRCDLPRNHGGAHASISVREFEVAA